MLASIVFPRPTSSARIARPPMSRRTRWATSIWCGSSLMALASSVISRSKPGTSAIRSASRRSSYQARSAGGSLSFSTNSVRERSSTSQEASGWGSGLGNVMPWLWAGGRNIGNQPRARAPGESLRAECRRAYWQVRGWRSEEAARPMDKSTRRLPPGPKGHFLLGNLPEFGKDLLGFITQCGREYGDIVRLRLANRVAYLLNHPDYMEYVLVTNHRNFVKNSFFWRHVKAVFGSGLLTSEGEFWLRERRLCQPAFHREQIAGYGTVMVDLTAQVLAAWHDGEGTTLFMSQWVIHRSSRYFPDPEAFMPDRWADGLAKRLPKYAYFPFGGGPRTCIGGGFAMMEAVLLLATIAQRFRLTLVPGHPIALYPSINLRPTYGVRVTLERRR